MKYAIRAEKLVIVRWLNDKNGEPFMTSKIHLGDMMFRGLRPSEVEGESLGNVLSLCINRDFPGWSYSDAKTLEATTEP